MNLRGHLTIDSDLDRLESYRLLGVQSLHLVDGGAAGVQAYLVEEQTRYAARVNCWQHVMFRTIAANPWFIDGGYLQIPQ